MSSLTVNYEFESLAELADALDTRADQIETMSEGMKLQRDQRSFKAQAHGLRYAARVVRNTTLMPKAQV
jgi:predicted LPLAT superfamily acyltransferase